MRITLQNGQKPYIYTFFLLYYTVCRLINKIIQSEKQLFYSLYENGTIRKQLLYSLYENGTIRKQLLYSVYENGTIRKQLF